MEQAERTGAAGAGGAAGGGALVVAEYAGARAALRPLLRIADDSEQEIDGYLEEGVMFVVREADDAPPAVGEGGEGGEGGEPVGHLLLTAVGDASEADAPGTLELKSMALVPRLQGRGGGRLLVEAAIAHCRARGVPRLVVATAAAGTGQLRFYQRCGFRMWRIERDAFGPHTGYAADLVIDGIPLRDRVWLAMDFDAARARLSEA